MQLDHDLMLIAEVDWTVICTLYVLLILRSIKHILTG